MKNESKDLSELIEEWRRENRVNCMEGTSGVDKFEKLCEAVGYSESGAFIGASPILNFLADNSGAIEAIIEWMGERNERDWIENITSELPEESEDNEE